MEGAKNLIIGLFIMVAVSTKAQGNQSIYNAFVTGNMARWKITMDSIYASNPDTQPELLSLVNYMYGYIAWSIDDGRRDEARRYLTKASNLIDRLWGNGYMMAVLHAYKAAFIGFEIGLAPFRAPVIGPRSIWHARESIRLDPSNSFGHVQLGNIAYHKPAIFGGSKPEALDHYLRALRLMEADPALVKGNWNYLNLLASIISVNLDMDRAEAARVYCQRAFALEPRARWIINQLCNPVFILE